VIQLVSQFLFFDQISSQLPPPTAAEFFAQYSSFSNTLKLSLGFNYVSGASTTCTKWINLVSASGVQITDEDVTIFIYYDKSINQIGTTSLDQTLIYYSIIPYQYTLATLPQDTPIPTLDSPAFIRVNTYGSTTYVNGFGNIIASDIKLSNAIVHILSSPFVLAPPCQPTDITCIHYDGWINTTIAADLATLTGYKTFVGLIQNAGITFPSPYTLFLIPDTAFSIGQNGPTYSSYFTSNTTAFGEYIKKLYCAGTIYPNIAALANVNVNSSDGTTYSFSGSVDGKSVTINNNYQASAYVRNDGVYYQVQISDPAELYPWDIPATPTAPSPGPVAPVTSMPTPNPSTATVLRKNGIQIWFYLFFALAILFLM